jgi:23S rRNA (guanosine2251-2'-O)-methyltransferase
MEPMKSRQKDFRRSRTAMHEKAGKARPKLGALPHDGLIYGLHAVEAALQNPKRLIRHAYLTENAGAKLGPMLSARGVAATTLHPQDFEGLVGASAVHQGAVLYAESLTQPSLDEYLDELGEEAPAVLAVLDQVTDPHNVGAVLRSAAAFGIAAVIVQDRHSPPLSGTLAKAASGAVEHVPIIATVNLARALERLKDHGFRCVGFDSEAPEQFDGKTGFTSRAALVFGAEDKGLRRLTREGCDALYALFVPGKIKSLNISNAAAIVFHEAAKTNQSA